jgi:type IV pilus assembly protein PilF
MRVLHPIVFVLLALLVLPASTAAQRDPFFDALFPVYRAMAGVYGDEGPALMARLDALAAVVAQWDQALSTAERQLRARLENADSQTALEVHTGLAAAYAERNRIGAALRELEAGIRIDPSGAALHRLRALLLRATGQPAAAAEAFREAWLLEPHDPQNAYRLVVHRSGRTTADDIEQATTTLARLERDLISGARGGATSPFFVLHPLSDDVGGVMAFAPAAYADALALLLDGEFEAGLAALRAAAATDPLVADPASRLDSMARGIAELRQGRVTAAVEHLETAVARAPDSSEAHRVLATAYATSGDVDRSVHHLREAVRLNPRDERAWIALVGTLDAVGDLDATVEVLRAAVSALPESGALRWVLSVLATERGGAGDALPVMAVVDRVGMLAGRGDLFARVANLARTHLDFERELDLLERRVALMPNDAAAYKAIGTAYLQRGQERAAHAALVIALLLEPTDTETLTALGRLHSRAGAYTRAVEALERAVALAPGDELALQALGDALVRAGRTSEGRERLRDAAVLQAHAVEAFRQQRRTAVLIGEADLLMHERQYEQAIEVWQAAIARAGASATLHLRLAEALEHAGQLEEAAVQLERAVALNPGPEAYRRLAALYAALGRDEDRARMRQIYVQQRLQLLRTPGD